MKKKKLILVTLLIIILVIIGSTVLSINNSEKNNNNEITAELEDRDVFYVTDAIKNDNNTYTLKGVIYSNYTISKNEITEASKKGKIELFGKEYIITENEYGEYELYIPSEVLGYTLREKDSNNYYLETTAQISEVYKLTDKYKQITVLSDLKCSHSYYDEQTTVNEFFENWESQEPIDSTNPSPVFKFFFENGKCVEIVQWLTSI